MKGSLKERFWAKVDKQGPDDCWFWTGNKGGRYGQITLEKGSFKKKEYVHKVSWFLHHGTMPSGTSKQGLCVLHRCDIKLCVNPGHLFLGTQLDNMQDLFSKGYRNTACGHRQGKVKLLEIDIPKIRKRIEEGLSYASIGRRFGVDHSSIRSIAIGKTWKHIK